MHSSITSAISAIKPARFLPEKPRAFLMREIKRNIIQTYPPMIIAKRIIIANMTVIIKIRMAKTASPISSTPLYNNSILQHFFNKINKFFKFSKKILDFFHKMF